MDPLVALFLVVINFFASLFQGITTFGDAIVLHILWHAMAVAVNGGRLHQTDLGDNDVAIITLLMYSRSVVLNALMVYLAAQPSGGIVKALATLPLSLVIFSALPQLLSTIVGEHLLSVLPEATLKFWFGVLCLTFALMYLALKVRDYVSSSSSRQQQTTPPSDITTTTAEGKKNNNDQGDDEAEEEEGSNVGVAAVYVSSPSSPTFSPSSDVAHCMDAEGRILPRVQYAAGVTALCGGIAGALTGVGGPPWMIYILALNIPSSFIRLLYPLTTLPSTYTRFALALNDHLIDERIAYYHLISVLSGVIGVIVGNRIGKLIGPTTFSVVVLVLLGNASMLMLVSNAMITTALLLVGIVMIVVVWRRERRTEQLSSCVATTTPTTASSEPHPVFVEEDQRHREALDDVELPAA